MVWLGRFFAAMAVTFAIGPAPVQAQTNYPERPVRIVVPIGPGGSYDLVGRALVFGSGASRVTVRTIFDGSRPAASAALKTMSRLWVNASIPRPALVFHQSACRPNPNGFSTRRMTMTWP